MFIIYLYYGTWYVGSNGVSCTILVAKTLIIPGNSLGKPNQLLMAVCLIRTLYNHSFLFVSLKADLV